MLDIEQISVTHLDIPLKTPMNISRGGLKRREHTLVSITSSDGFVGIGEAIGHSTRAAKLLKTEYANRVLKSSFSCPQDVISGLVENDVYFERAGTTWSIASAVEVAFWDLTARREGRSVFDQLATQQVEQPLVYASHIYWDEDPMKMADLAQSALSWGVSGVKIHIGRLDPEDEVNRISAVRDAIGSETALMIDLNAGYSREQVRRAAICWKDFDFEWVEEPLAPDDLLGLIEIAEETGWKIAFGENTTGVGELSLLADLFNKKQLPFVAMPDLGRIGGISKLALLADSLRGTSSIISPHNYSSGCLFAATYNAFGLGKPFEWLEIDLSDNAYFFQALEASPAVQAGRLTLDQFQGLGCKVDTEWIERYASELSFGMHKDH